MELVDQRLLPAEFVKLQCRDTGVLFDAIKTLAVRGAPAIGVSAAYGLVLALQKSNASDGLEKALELLAEAREYLASSRPTAVNLFWALDRMHRKAQELVASRPCTRPFWPRQTPFTRKMWTCAGGSADMAKGLSGREPVF